MSVERYHYLLTTPHTKLRLELILRLQNALSHIDSDSETLAPMRLLIARVNNPKSLVDPKKWIQTIKLWYMIVDSYPEIGRILSEYDIECQHKQALMCQALEAKPKLIAVL